MNATTEFSDIEYKESFVDFLPFQRMKVRLKEEIVRFKVDDLQASDSGEYLTAKEWDKIIQQDDAIVALTPTCVSERRFIE
mgnify:CR=1 FL=1